MTPLENVIPGPWGRAPGTEGAGRVNEYLRRAIGALPPAAIKVPSDHGRQRAVEAYVAWKSGGMADLDSLDHEEQIDILMGWWVALNSRALSKMAKVGRETRGRVKATLEWLKGIKEGDDAFDAPLLARLINGRPATLMLHAFAAVFTTKFSGFTYAEAVLISPGWGGGFTSYMIEAVTASTDSYKTKNNYRTIAEVERTILGAVYPYLPVKEPEAKRSADIKKLDTGLGGDADGRLSGLTGGAFISEYDKIKAAKAAERLSAFKGGGDK